MAELAVILVAGFAGSFHCIGMCGGFACGLGGDPGGSRWHTVARHLLYNLGRVVSYAFLGALAGSLGACVIDRPASHVATAHAAHPGTAYVLAGELGIVQRTLSVLAGVLMLAMALQLLGVVRHARARGALAARAPLASILGAVLASRHRAMPVCLGVVNGFLPCPLVYAFVAVAVAAGSAGAGALIMTAFGLGTFPAMLLVAGAGRTLAPTVRRRGVRLAACFVLALGILTVVRGVAPALLHLPGHGV